MDELHSEIEQLIGVLELLDRLEFTEFQFEGPNLKVLIRRGMPPREADPVDALDAARGTLRDEPLPEPQPAPPAIADDSVNGVVKVTAPLVGLFYRSPQPGAQPFVEVGDSVEPDSVVCIIESMKLMHAIEAGVGGVVSEICVANGAAVEYDEVLIKVQPELSR